MIGGVGLGVATLIGGGVWAASSFLGTGAQPAEVLPASTLAYVSLDLDPSGSQKVEAIRTLGRFPALQDALGSDRGEDLRKPLITRALGAGDCAEIDYDSAIAPWLGERFAAAAIDNDGERPDLALVVQVSDEAAAEAGLTAIGDCAGAAGMGGWTVADGWAVVAETREIAEAVRKDAAEESLAADPTYQRWTAEAGDRGILHAYAAPAAGEALARLLPSLPSQGDLSDDFPGFAGALRFDGGGVEFEFAGGSKADGDDDAEETIAGELVGSLPAETAVALGLGLTEGWAAEALDALGDAAAGLVDLDEVIARWEAETGIDADADAEKLLGDSVALALDGGISLETLANSADGTGVPIGIKVAGDPDEIEDVLDRLRAQLGGAGHLLGSVSSGDRVAIGPDEAFRDRLLQAGGLAETASFEAALPDAERAVGLFYLNFDAGDGWLVEMVEQFLGDQDLIANLEPLGALGASAWVDGDVAHGRIRLTTD